MAVLSGETRQQQRQNEVQWPQPRQEECPGDAVGEERGGGGAHLFMEKDPSNSVFIKCCFLVSFLFKTLLKIVIHHFYFMRNVSTIL